MQITQKDIVDPLLSIYLIILLKELCRYLKMIQNTHFIKSILKVKCYLDIINEKIR